jgi:hypothetical protein
MGQPDGEGKRAGKNAGVRPCVRVAPEAVRALLVEVEYEITREDYGLAQARLIRIIPRVRNTLVGMKIVLVVVTFLLLWTILERSLVFSLVTAAVVAVILTIPMDWITAWMMKRVPSEGQGTLGRHRLRIGEDGVWEATDVNEGLASWKSVTHVILDNRFVYIVIGNTMAHTIPVRAFTDLQSAESFVEEARRLWRASAS